MASHAAKVAAAKNLLAQAHNAGIAKGAAMATKSQAAGAASAPGGITYVKDFFVYVLAFNSMAAGATKTVVLNIQSDADFIWMKSTRFANLHGGTAPFTNAQLSELQITNFQDSGSGRNLISTSTGNSMVDNIFGTGELPFIMPIPRIFKANANFNVTLLNVSAANQYDNITLALVGVKDFAYEASSGG